MKWTTSSAVVVFILIQYALSGAGKAYDNGDSQLWLDASLQGNLYRNFSIKLEQNLKNGDNMKELYDVESYLAVGYPLTDWLKLGAGFRLAYVRKNTTVYTESGGIYTAQSDHYWNREKRPTGEITFSHQLAGWKLADRIRIEWRMKEGSKEYFRYRNRIKISSPWQLTDAHINPWIAWEAFYSDQPGNHHWDRHRLYAGLNSHITETVSPCLYYCLQEDKDGDHWRAYHILGLSLGCGF